MEPHFEHDCDNCTFLGNYNGEDLYYCTQNNTYGTVIVRKSSYGPDYFSGLPFAKETLKESRSPGLRVAYLIARDKGLCSEEDMIKVLPKERNKNKGSNIKRFE